MRLSVCSWVSSLRRLPPSVPQVVLSTIHARAAVPDYEDAVYHRSGITLYDPLDRFAGKNFEFVPLLHPFT